LKAVEERVKFITGGDSRFRILKVIEMKKQKCLAMKCLSCKRAYPLKEVLTDPISGKSKEVEVTECKQCGRNLTRIRLDKKRGKPLRR
jgi:NAD-dependent SIR2 family protein deacetylase